jgi:hypothetical protein
MKARTVKFYQAVEFGKNKAITFLNVDSYKTIITLSHLHDLQLSVLDHGVMISAKDHEDVIVPFNNVAYYQVMKSDKAVKAVK